MLLLLMPLGRVLTLPLAGGSIALSGQAAALSHGRSVPAASGAFALAGEVSSFHWNHSVPAAFGAFALAGQDVEFAVSDLLDVGAFSLTGMPVNFFLGSLVTPAGVAKIAWRSQGLTSIVPAPARATFNWKV